MLTDILIGLVAFDLTATIWCAFEKRRLRRAIADRAAREMTAVAIAACLAKNERVLASMRAGVVVRREDVQC